MFDLEAARKAGYTDAEIADGLAQRFSFDIKRARGSGYSDGEIISRLVQQNATLSPAAAIPTAPTAAQAAQGSREYMAPAATNAAPSNPGGVLNNIVGAGETALAALTGATGGTLGMIGGTVGATAGAILDGSFGTPQAAQMIEQAASEGAQKMTFAPRTEAGQAQTAALGEVAQNLVPLVGLAPQMAGMVPRSAAPARVTARAATEGVARDIAGPAGAAAAAKAIDRVAALPSQITTLPRRAIERLRATEDAAPTPGTMGSVGAAGTDMAAQRVAVAESMPVPLQLTRGQVTRNPAQLKFEVETAKMPEQGAPLRQRLVQQNEQILQNFDHWIDETGARAPSLRAVGQEVDRALVNQAAADKARINAAYRAAREAGEMEDPVTLAGMVQHLNESAPDAATAPLLSTARARAVRLGIAAEGADGNLVPQPVTLRIAETYRQAIGQATDYAPTNIRQATIIKGLVDEATSTLGGQMYREARALRRRYAQNYEDRAAVSKLLNNKRGTADRQVALEDVFKHTILDGSLDDVRNVRRVLQRSADQGNQAWRELQGATASYIRDQAVRNVATDGAGNRVISPAGLDKAIRTLDVDGRLDFIFGKRGAQQMRDINELAQIARTVPPEAAINTSNTAMTMLAGFVDVGSASMTGVPIPLATSYRVVRQYVQDRALRKRIEDALGERARRPASRRPPPTQAPVPQTIQ